MGITNFDALLTKSVDEFTAYLARNRMRTKPPQHAERIRKIFTHKNPHLDEYFGILLFRAALPENRRLVPLCEISLETDGVFCGTEFFPYEKHPFKSAALIGIGSGLPCADEAVVLMDEHDKKTDPGTIFSSEKGFSHESAAMLIKDSFIGANVKIPPGLYCVLSEVNHIDGYGGAYAQHISTYIKQLHECPDCDARCKEAMVLALLVSLLLSLEKGEKIFATSYWMKTADAQIKSFIADTPLSTHDGFAKAAKSERFFFTTGMSQAIAGTKLYMKNPFSGGQGGDEYICDKTGRPVMQRILLPLLLPGLQALCADGEFFKTICHTLFNAAFSAQLDFEEVFELLNTWTKGRDCAQSVISAEGFEAEFIDVTPAVDASGSLDISWRDCQPGGPGGIKIISVRSERRAKNAVTAYINKMCGGLGIVLYRDTATGSTVLSKGSKIDETFWKNMVDKVLAMEGSSDSDPPGCWHKVSNLKGYAPFIVNGNSAHRNLPKSKLQGQDLARMI